MLSCQRSLLATLISTLASLFAFRLLLRFIFFITQEADVVVEHLEQAIDVVLLDLVPLDALVLRDLQDRGGQQVLDGRLRLLDYVPQAIEHVAEAVRLALVVEHLVEEDGQGLVAEEVRVEGSDLGRLQKDRAQRFHYEGIVVHIQHLDQVADNIIVI